MTRYLATLVVLCSCSASANTPGGMVSSPVEPETSPTSERSSVSVVAPPDELDAAHVFKGRVLATGTDVNAFCRTTYYDSEAEQQVFTVELVECSNTEDEVAVSFVERGLPTRSDAIADLGGRFDGCLEQPAFLPMVTWPSGENELAVPDWDLVATRKGAALSLVVNDNETAADPVWELEIPTAHEIESVHFADSFVIVRTVGTENDKPISICHTTKVWGP